MAHFLTELERHPIIITEGSVVERIRRNSEVQLDPLLVNAGLIYDAQGKIVLSRIYREYLEIGRRFGLPMLVLTPTWRANPERIAESRHYARPVNEDCVEFLNAIREQTGEYAKSVFIGGLMGCKGDAYRPQEALSTAAAAAFHSEQAGRLAVGGVDFIMASTLPSVAEACGMAMAIAACRIPYSLSFVIRPQGVLLDGTPIHQAIERIDAEVSSPPFGYMINCVHPQIFAQALNAESQSAELFQRRLIGFQANASSKSPEELDALDYLDTTEPDIFAAAMVAIHYRFGVRFLGGCCGTDNRHIEHIAAAIANQLAQAAKATGNSGCC